MIDDPFIAQILAEAEALTEDEDRKQTYLLARLEGDDAEAATKRASRARASLDYTQSKDRGPRDVLGRGVKLTDYNGESWQSFESVTQDNRTREEKDKEKEQRAFVDELLELITPRQFDVLTRIYGIDCEPMSYDEIAAELNMSRGNVAVTATKARNAIREYAGGI